MKKIILLSFLILLAALTPAQVDVSPKTYVANISTSDNLNVKAEVLYDKQTVTADKDLSYYWMASNKVFETKGGYDGRLLHGAYSVFYSDHNLKEQGHFYKGLKDGKWISWYSNGKIAEVSHWKKGLKSGTYEVFNETGQKVVEATFKKGKLNGTMTSYSGDKVLSQKKYTHGEEVKEKPKRKWFSSKNKEKTPKEKRSLKERWKNLFQKKKKDEDPPPKKPEKDSKKSG